MARSGRLSWFGGPHDPSDSGRTALGLTTATPGLAIRPGATYQSGRPYLGGYWRVELPNGRSVILRQTDIGPNQSTGRRVDFTYSALKAAGYNEGNFPTDATAKFYWLGHDKNRALRALSRPGTVFVDGKGRVIKGRQGAASRPSRGSSRPGRTAPTAPTTGGFDPGESQGGAIAALVRQYLGSKSQVAPPSMDYTPPSFQPKSYLGLDTSGWQVPQRNDAGLTGLLSSLSALSGAGLAPSGSAAPNVAPVTGGASNPGKPSGRGRAPRTPGLKGGRVIIAPGANRAGVDVNRRVTTFLSRVSAIAGLPIKVTTGSNHNRMTTTGNVSDHWAGNAGDIGIGSNMALGDRIAASALVAAGVSPSKARSMARNGGVWNFQVGGRRVQILWRTNVGGNHFNHVHIGVR